MKMREIINLIETTQRPTRYWIGPDGQFVEVHESHTLAVLEHPEVFGLQGVDFQQDDDDFDFEEVLYAAQDKGWVRVSNDITGARPDAIAVSANSLPYARKALRRLAEISYISCVELEISWRVNASIYYVLDDISIDRFLKRGIAPQPSR